MNGFELGESNYITEDEEEEEDISIYTIEGEDLYARLNVSKNATAEEITSAYRRLSRMYHPDKHMNNKAEAEALFSKIKQAYEVLSDPSQRAVFDTIGLDGLEAQGKELVARFQTPQEIREAYERLEKDKQDRDMERRTNPKGSVTVKVSCTEMFNPYVPAPTGEEYEYYYPVPLVEMTGLNFVQSVEAPLTSKDTLVMGGSVASENGVGSGNISLGVRRTFSHKSWGEFDIGGSTNGLDFGLKGFSQFGKRFFGNFNVSLINTNGSLGTGVALSLGHQLDTHTVGTLTWRTGHGNGTLVGGLIRDDGTNRVGLTVHLGVPHIYGMIQTSHKREELKFRLNGRVGTFGASVEYGMEKKISEYSTLGALVIVGVPQGIMLRLKVVRGNQSYIFPIHFAEDIIPSALIYASVAPFFGYMLLKLFFFDPNEKERLKEEKDKAKMAYRSKMKEQRSNAENAVRLMEATYLKLRTEEGKNGLLIEEAVYGRLFIGENETLQDIEEIIDVTIPVQCLVQRGSLIIHRGSKVHLPGFYDPSPGEQKSLRIKYRFNNRLHECITKDEEIVKIPKKGHQVPEPTEKDKHGDGTV